MPSATRLLHVQARLGEGAIWDKRDRVLWWVDIDGQALHRFDPASGNDRWWPMPSQVGTVVPRTSGGVVVALRDSIVAFDPATATSTTLATADLPGQRFNDGKCDPAGRLWVGALAIDGGTPRSHLYRLAAGGVLEPQLDGIAISNGLAWSADRTTFWYIDTPTRRIDAFDYDLASGRISNRRPAVVFPDGVGFPDGMTIDAEDTLWVAMWDGGAVLRCDPRRGTIVERLAVPGARNITSCAFGGNTLDTLYITSARGDHHDPAHPDGGDLFSARPVARGVEAAAYAG
jgi:sugar lactone lactonase YvrE